MRQINLITFAGSVFLEVRNAADMPGCAAAAEIWLEMQARQSIGKQVPGFRFHAKT
jgi:hypothetical protein